MNLFDKFKNEVQHLKLNKDYEGLFYLHNQAHNLHRSVAEDPKKYLINALEELGDEKAIKTIAKIIAINATHFGRIASESLSRMGSPELVAKYAFMAYEDGVKLLGRTSINAVNLKTGIQYTFSLLGEEAVGPLLEILTRKDISLKLSVFYKNILDNCITENSIELLRKKMFNPHRRARGIIIDALCALSWEPTTLKEKVAIYIQGNWEELEKLGEPAVEYLIEEIEDLDNNKLAQDYWVPKIITFLGKIRCAKTINFLVLTLNNNIYPKITIMALANIGDKQAIVPILNHIRSSNHLSFLFNSSIYINALTKIGKPAQNELNLALNDSNKNLQRIAKKTLKQLKSQST